MNKLIAIIILTFNSTLLFAQNNDVEMADALRASGKIYVVIVTVVIVFAGLTIYLFALDRRLKKIEKENSHKI